MHSNRTIHYALKFGGFILGAATIVFSGIRYSWPGLGLFKDPSPPELLDTTITLLFGVAFFAGGLFYSSKLVLLEIDPDRIILSKKHERRTIAWEDVESIQIKHLKAFPCYRLKLKNDERLFFFVTENYWRANMFWQDGDPSEMGLLIAQKKKQLGI